MSASAQPAADSVSVHRLRGARGLAVDFLSLGGIVTRILAPDRHGRLGDVVLGFADPARYREPHPYFGAIAGRVAGRISGARFTLDGLSYRLAANDGANHLHGGPLGFHLQPWRVEPQAGSTGVASYRLSRRSADGEEGYPGNVDVRITYSVTDDNVFIIETEATTDRATPFSLTHHSYFNLAGESSGSIEDHYLEIQADTFAPTDEAMTLLGRRTPVDTANDFRQARRLGDAIPTLFQRHGDLYFLPTAPSGPKLRRVARLLDPASGRVLTVSTDEACLQLYTGASLDGSLVGKSSRPYGRHAGLCLECEGYPDAANHPDLDPADILRPGQTLRRTTHYAFSVAP